MLVLTRKVGQEIKIGEGVSIRINGVQGGRVRVGIEAKPDVQVRRGELAWEPEELCIRRRMLLDSSPQGG